MNLLSGQTNGLSRRDGTYASPMSAPSPNVATRLRMDRIIANVHPFYDDCARRERPMWR